MLQILSFSLDSQLITKLISQRKRTVCILQVFSGDIKFPRIYFYWETAHENFRRVVFLYWRQSRVPRRGTRRTLMFTNCRARNIISTFFFILLKRRAALIFHSPLSATRTGIFIIPSVMNMENERRVCVMRSNRAVLMHRNSTSADLHLVIISCYRSSA